MNLDFEIKKLLVNSQKPISDFKLIDEYAKENNQTKEQTLKFVENYCKSDYPIQYLVGFEYFFDKKIKVNKNVLIPRMETEEVVLALVNKIKEKYSKKEEIKLLDLCTGSGAIVIGINKYLSDYNIKYYASDISSKALEVAQFNFTVHKINALLIKSDLFLDFEEDMIFDVIISNPPYLSKDGIIEENVTNYEPNIALFAENDGMLMYERILSNIYDFLKKEAIVCFEIGHDQKHKISKLIINQKICDKFVIIKDINKFDRVFLLIRGGNDSLSKRNNKSFK